jgi:hypothetical protein
MASPRCFAASTFCANTGVTVVARARTLWS